MMEISAKMDVFHHFLFEGFPNIGPGLAVLGISPISQGCNLGTTWTSTHCTLEKIHSFLTFLEMFQINKNLD